MLLSDEHLRSNIGILDAVIGQMAVDRDLPLCTFNRKHYAAVPRLRIEAPYPKGTAQEAFLNIRGLSPPAGRHSSSKGPSRISNLCTTLPYPAGSWKIFDSDKRSLFI
ncbi:MAG: type II toxin-antitoxin system VapC family toxin [Vicinamibacteria bacterium]